MKKKILFIAQLPPPIHGASVMNQRALNILKEAGYNIKVVELRFVKNVSDIGTVTVGKILKMLIVGGKILKSLFVFKPDIVYFTLSPTGVAFYRDVVYVMILKLFDSEIIYHLHGKGIRDNLTSKWKKKFYEFVFKNTTVIHLSEILENDISGLGYKKIFFVPNGIEVRDVLCDAKKNTEKVNLLFLSNLTVSKGLILLLSACKIIKQKGISFNLNVVGKEFDITYDNLKMLITESGLEKNVQILGPKYGEEKVNIFLQSDIFVFPTFRDCFPLVVLEAMQFGLPVISTYEGAIPEIVDDGVTGFLVPQRNIEALAEKIEILIRDKELRKKMGQAGKEKFFKKYTLDKYEENLLRVFNNLRGKNEKD